MQYTRVSLLFPFRRLSVLKGGACLFFFFGKETHCLTYKSAIDVNT